MSTIEENLLRVKEKIEAAAKKARRDPSRIKLIAVTKTMAVEKIQKAIQAGATIFGENYIQEASQKIEEIGHAGIQWHFIGHLQTNKAKYAVKLFDVIHSVDSIKVAAELNSRAAAIGKVMNCLIEVNLSQEESKFGISQERTPELASEMNELKNISLQGLMTMPPYFDDPELARPYFIALRKLQKKIVQDGIPLPELSMGMSTDFEVAIEEGATMVRVGRAIFGERSE
ncbi:MAG: YggS family pyridoxal phosphate-dependent enzyme [Deltaproteobacteria bacterium]|nr:YggS family pyridoxal phosphate-dependent enzyme [Deltaproteobacteria bacterium]